MCRRRLSRGEYERIKNRMVELNANGRTNAEIAALLGMRANFVGDVLRKKGIKYVRRTIKEHNNHKCKGCVHLEHDVMIGDFCGYILNMNKSRNCDPEDCEKKSSDKTLVRDKSRDDWFKEFSTKNA